MSSIDLDRRRDCSDGLTQADTEELDEENLGNVSMTSTRFARLLTIRNWYPLPFDPSDPFPNPIGHTLEGGDEHENKNGVRERWLTNSTQYRKPHRRLYGISEQSWLMANT